MTKYKYPFIRGGKNMVAAVLGACQYIRETGYFNKAVTIYSSRYGVDREELEQNIRARQAAGQKGQSRKYYWFIVEKYDFYAEAGVPCVCQDTFNGLTVRKATSEKNACKSWSDNTGSAYDNVHIEIAIGKYDTEAEAYKDVRLRTPYYVCSAEMEKFG